MTLAAIEPALRVAAAGAILQLRGGKAQALGVMLERMADRWSEVHPEWSGQVLEIADEILGGGR